jgi:outer membrane protein assembly factor BamB
MLRLNECSKQHILLLFCLLVTLGLSACTSLTDMKSDLSERMFGREVADPPAELSEIKATLTPKVIWKAQLGKADQFDFLPATSDGAVYAASAVGDLFKLNAATGKETWKVNVGERLSGGVGLGAKLVLVGSASGYVIAYDLSGKLLWKSKVSSEVLSAPQVSDETVVVRCGDSRIFGLSTLDGKHKWVYERTTPALSLRSSAGVVVDSGAAYAGFAGGKLIALRVEDGKVIWEATVAQPKGATEIERIADITSLPVIDGSVIYAVAYQGKISAVDRASGRVGWSRDISSYTGISADDGRVYVSHATGSVYSLDYASGRTFWRQGDLVNRQLSAPLPMGGVIALGDVEGYIHLLDREDGSFSGRIQLEKSPVMPQLVALGTNGLLAQTRDGGLYAISLK